MTNEELLKFIISSLNMRYNVNVALTIKKGIHQLLPALHKKSNCKDVEILFNPSMYTCFFLCENQERHILFRFLISHKYALYNRYSECERWIEKCYKSLNRRRLKQYVYRKKYSELQLEYKFYEVIFVLLHEFSHALFNLRPEIKNEYLERVKSNLLDLTHIDNIEKINKAVLSDIPWFSRPYFANFFNYERIERSKNSFHNLINTSSRLEELSCDLHACDIIQLMIENSRFSNEEMCYIYRHCVDSLYYVEFLNTFDECITGKIDMKTAEDRSFFDSTRYATLSMHITLLLESRKRGLGLAFDHYPILNKSTLDLYRKMTKCYLSDISDLWDGALFPDKSEKEKYTTSIGNLELNIMQSYL